MTEINKTTTIQVYKSIIDLDTQEQVLLNKAIQMLDNVYAPYSEFYVGSAVLTETGNIYGGCNQENASYPLCICGERVALYNAGANEPRSAITMIAIVAHNPKKFIEKPISPCGACRQVITEFAMRHKQDYPILLKGDSDIIYKMKSTKELLPFGFDSEYL